MGAPYGVYIHIPFCASKCDYCAFATWTDRHHLTTAYLQALRTDIARSVAAGMPPASSMFVGGGTPSLVPAHELAEVIAAVPVLEHAEITVECNPDNVTTELLQVYVDAGVNRVSVGVQSMHSRTLGALGRRHDEQNVRRAVAAIGEVGLPSFNLDVIYGAAGETIDEWQATVDAVLALNPPHVSAYALTIEPGTPLATQPERHPQEDDQADKYLAVDNALQAAGLQNYEISNWALPGHECRHNVLYWQQLDYAAFGCAAHGHARGRRWWNVRTPERYIKHIEANQSPEASHEVLDDATRRFERLELLLRMSSGVPVAALEGEQMPGLVERRNDRWVLTQQGRLLANEISLRLDDTVEVPFEQATEV